jgi:putative transposase
MGVYMPRLPRKKSESGIYHIILRGSNRQVIFHDDADRIRFLDTVNRYKKKTKIKVYCWCLMSNHIHLLLEEGNEDISLTIKRIGVSFVWFYNQKYKTTGHLFQDRFRSENVEDDSYLLTVVRYIHNNPVKAGIVESPISYGWSSCSGYYECSQNPTGLLDDEFVLGLFSENKSSALEEFKEFNEQENEDNCLDDKIRIRLSDEEAKEEIIKIISKEDIIKLKSLPKKNRDEIICKIKRIEGLSQRQLARILGISQNLIFKA